MLRFEKLLMECSFVRAAAVAAAAATGLSFQRPAPHHNFLIITFSELLIPWSRMDIIRLR